MEKTEEELLDLNFATLGNRKIKIGELTQKVIDILDLNRKPCNIVMWNDRLKYSEKHKIDFNTEEEYNLCMQKIPIILKQPDYVGIHPTDNSIQYIKQIDKLMLVGIRIKPTGEMCYRSAYPINEFQLKNYITTNRAKKYENDV